MNNFLKILKYLKAFEGDGKFHVIEDIINVNADSKRLIFKQLSQEGLLILKGGHWNTDMLFTIGDGNGNWFTPNIPDQIVYYPHEGQITLKGSQYLKNESKDMSKQKIQIRAKGQSNVNLIVNSEGARISKQADKIIYTAERIIEVLNSDRSITEKKKVSAKRVITKLAQEVKEGAIHPSTWQQVIAIGSDIASVGSLVLSLIALK